MAIIDSIYELIKKEFDLICGNSMLMLGHIFFHVIIDEIKNNAKNEHQRGNHMEAISLYKSGA